MPKNLRYKWPKEPAESIARLSSPDSIDSSTPLSVVRPPTAKRLLCAMIWTIVKRINNSPLRNGQIALRNLSKDLPGFRQRLYKMKRDLRTFIEPLLLSGTVDDYSQHLGNLAVTLRFIESLDAMTKTPTKTFRFSLPKVSIDTEALRNLTVLDVLLALPRVLPQEKELRSKAILNAIKKPAPLPEGTLLRICNAIAFGESELVMSRFRLERKTALEKLKR